MKKYDNYKDSEIEWLGEIPEHWIVGRIKDYCNTASGTTPASKNKFFYQKGKYNWIRTTDLNNSFLYNTEYRITDLALEECRLKFMPIDSVLIAMYGGFGTIGKNALLKKESTINQSVCAIIPNPEKLNSLYLQFFLQFFRYEWKIFADGTRKDPNINQDSVKNLFLYVPPLPEQTAIAHYLDTKTKAIDQKINLLQQKITHYQTLRKSIINKAVCRGLDDTVALKDSGIEWIGQIPEHWEVRRVKDIFEVFTGNSISDKSKYSKKGNTLSYIATKDIDLFTGIVDYDNGVYIPYEDGSLRIAKADSTLVCLEGANAGKKVGFIDKDVCFVNKLCAFQSDSKDISGKFYFFVLSSMVFKYQFFPLISGLIGGVSINRVKNFSILIMPIAEQKQIANYLDEKTTTIDKIVGNLQNQIDNLQDFRKVLINDVVTGKIKVID